MKKRLEMSDAGAHKFWEVEVSDATMTVTFGKIGTGGQSKAKTLGSPAEALAEAAKLIAEKTKKGYGEAGAPSRSEEEPKATESGSILPPGLAALVGGDCFIASEDSEEDVVLFDWWTVPAQVRGELLSDVFNDCVVPGDYPALLGRSTGSSEIEWTSRTCVPFALVGVQSGTNRLGADGQGVPQFHRMLLIDAAGAAYAIEVDGTATPAKEPPTIAKSWEKLRIKRRAPIKTVEVGALPKVKATKHRRLVGSWGDFVPVPRDPVMVRGIQLSADAKLAVLSVRNGKEGTRVHRVDTGELVRTLGEKPGSAAISPDGALAVTTQSAYDAGQVHIGTCWDLATGQQRWSKELQKGDNVLGLRISPRGDLLVAGAEGNGIKAYRLDGQLLWAQPLHEGQFEHPARAVAFNPEGTSIAVAGSDGVIRILALQDGRTTKTIKDDNAIQDLAWLPDGSRLVSHSSHLTAIWDLESGKQVKKLREWDRGRLAGEIAISALGLIVGCTIDGKIDVWNLEGDVVDQIDLKGKIGAWCLAACPGGFVVGTSGGCALRFELTP